MKLQITRVTPNQIILCTDGKKSLVAEAGMLVRHDQGGQTHYLQPSSSVWRERVLSRWRLTRQALRLGILNAQLCDDDTILAVAKGRIMRSVSMDGCLETCHVLRPGMKPCFNGIAVLPSGVCFCGEYLLNHQRTQVVALLRSKEKSHSFERIFEFSPGRVRHIHFVQWDSYDNCLWMGTGDRDEECLLMRTFDLGKSWEIIGQGSQLWRATGLVFTKDCLYWAMDAGRDTGTTPSFIVRMDRNTGRTVQLVELQGPCHSCGQLKDGTLLFSTGIEGGVNEKHTCAHIWASRDGEHWEDLAYWQKDAWPLRIQYGIIRFPHGLEKSSVLHFTTLGLKGCAETWHVARIVD